MEALTREHYPLGLKKPDLLRTPTGKQYRELTLDAAIRGEVQAEDLRISSETLQMHAQICDSLGKTQQAKNFRRAAELIGISDTRILEIYHALRPRRSTKEELLAIAEELEKQYGARENAALIREAAKVYEKRNLLRQSEE
ncbi:diol dehydratase small subunit [Aneurinibacillus thermoaerophilus]|uniref:diol dehydratase small subunit n=1 Tax=Aneurinibacillus TaxID=55079 RepID=UPI0007091DAF|nr:MULTISPECIES: diol dehydratase small subunit [Aneurinibacillus]AMA73916.1 glycerol dehydrogenase [Aneurinibacillus sp. XH2]MED0678090.1 diol dehydratase small subunit [Aneurinibacillus thermoaerophilus]MED0764174.1 diol dehydratase small subunit [Aneurinibacillus thermoaerophilus]